MRFGHRLTLPKGCAIALTRTAATHELSQSPLSRPTVSVVYRGSHCTVSNARLFRTVERKPPIARGHRSFIGKQEWR